MTICQYLIGNVLTYPIKYSHWNSKNTQSKSYRLSLIEGVWEFHALWDALFHEFDHSQRRLQTKVYVYFHPTGYRYTNKSLTWRSETGTHYMRS